MRRGEIWWASLAAPDGSGPGYRRPVVIVQSNPFNASAIHTAVVVAITANLRLADAPGNVRLSKSESGLTRPSVVNVSQVVTVDRGKLTERVAQLRPEMVRRVDEGLRLVLDLPA